MRLQKKFCPERGQKGQRVRSNQQAATSVVPPYQLTPSNNNKSMASKPSRTGTGPPKPVEESADGVPKPLAATLMAEFQNLKDKFKNEDDVQEKGAWRGDQRGAAFGGGM